MAQPSAHSSWLKLAMYAASTLRKLLVAFAGIDALPYQSGTVDVHSRSISKRDSALLRRTLLLVMGVILQNSPADEPFYQFMDKKRAEGKLYRVLHDGLRDKFLRIYYASVKAHLDTWYRTDSCVLIY